jgi:hypothetical protein
MRGEAGGVKISSGGAFFYSGRGRAARHGLVDHGDDGTVAERSGR